MMNYQSTLLEKINGRSAIIGVIGLGYVGLPLALAFAEAGFQVIGVDVDDQKVQQLLNGESYVGDVAPEQVGKLVKNGRFRPTTQYATLAQADTISICVPTPLTKTKEPDISYIIDATDRINQIGATGKLIVLESTTYPGTTEEILLPRLRDNGDEVGRDFFLAFSPERMDPGRTDYTIYTTPKVLGGMTPTCLEIGVALYGRIVQQVIPVSDTATAEMVKILENTFRAVNIGLVNEMAIMCDRLGINVWEVVEAASTKPYGFMPFYPGPGLGGHCIPIDPHYLSWKLRTLNITARFIELATEVNSFMPDYVVQKIGTGLNETKKAINGSQILILGVSYKPNVNDVRESPALPIIHRLQQFGAEVRYHDPHVPTFDLASGETLTSIRLTKQALAEADCTVIVANHDFYDWACIAETAPLIVDTRNAIRVAKNGRLVKL